MGFLDRIKNMFVEEIDGEDEIKKVEMQVTIPRPDKDEPKEEKIEKTEAPKKSVEVRERDDEDIVKQAPRIREDVRERTSEVPSRAKHMPTYFDDEDFEDLGSLVSKIEKEPIPEPKPKVVKQEYNYRKVETYTPTSSISSPYGIKKESPRKSFTPTPIISPVYGILDKNYKKDEIKPKKQTKRVSNDNDRVSVDEIRKKAYGSLEEEFDAAIDLGVFEDEIDDVNEDTYAEEVVENAIDIFEELQKDDEEVDNFLNDYENKSLEELYNDNDSILEDELNNNYEELEEELKVVPKKTRSTSTTKKTTKRETKKVEKNEDVQNLETFEEELNKSFTETDDSDLFNLIDSMYRDREGE